MPNLQKKAGKYSRRKNPPVRILILAAAVVLALGSVGGLLAKYRSEQIEHGEMVAADFHFSSNYLEEDPPTHTVSDWTDGFTLELYNFEKENTALVSALEVGYTVTVSSDQFEVIDAAGTLPAGGTGEAVCVTVRPRANTGVTVKSVTVTVNTTPYNEGLSAEFVLVGLQSPELKIENHGTHYTAKVYSNQHSGNVKLTWAEGLIPDAANDIVRSWNGGSFPVEPFHTYEIIFFNPEGVSSPEIVFAE